MEMARIGATIGGGCDRQALTTHDLAGRELLTQWAVAIGCRKRVDPAGNLFLRREGADRALSVVMTGSHLDTQPTGGKFDGVYGVLAGLEVIETLNDFGIVPLRGIELAVWSNEEGCRFPMAMMGSAVWSGRLPLEVAHALSDREGLTVIGELGRLGIATDVPLVRQPVFAALELHIEQGPVLEERGKRLGIVTGVQHMSRYQVTVEGQEAHAGPTPMHSRHDPIRVLATVLPQLYAEVDACGAEARLTIGRIDTLPGSPNTVPGRLRFTIDVRHPDLPAYRSLRVAVEGLVRAAIERHRLVGDISCVWEAPGVVFDSSCIDAVRRAALTLNVDAMDMVSGAGHDSCNLTAVVPTGMIFIPCAGGLSHNEAESVTASDVETGANVLLHAMLSLAEA